MPMFSRVTADDFHSRFESRGDVPRIVQLRPFEYTARYPFSRDPARICLTADDFHSFGTDGRVMLKEGLAHLMFESVKRTQADILARGNGLTWEDIVERRLPVPSSIHPDVLFQLQMSAPPLLPPALLDANYLLLPGLENEVHEAFELTQMWFFAVDAWGLQADDRKLELDDMGQPCLWNALRLHDHNYRNTDVTAVPVYDSNAIVIIVGGLLQQIAPTHLTTCALQAPILGPTRMQMMGGSYPTVVMDPSLLKPLPIAFSASSVDGPMLLLLASSAPSTQILRANLFPGQAVVVPAPAADIIIVTGDD